MDYTMQASVHPVPLQVSDWWMNTSQVRGQSRCPHRRGLTEGTAIGTQTGGFGDGSVIGITEGAGGAGGSQPNHGQSTTTTTTATTTSSHHQQSNLPHPPPLLPPASTLHHSFLFSHTGYSDNFLPLPHPSYYSLPPIQIQQIPPPPPHEPTPPSFSRHLSDPSPTSHSANRGYDPVHAASDSNSNNNNDDMNSRGRTGQESGRGNGGNAGNNMNNQGGNRQTGPPATSHVHQYGNNRNRNSHADDGNVAAPTAGGSTTSVSGGNAVTSGTGLPNSTWFFPQNTTTSWPSLPSLAPNFQGQPPAPVIPFPDPLSGPSSMTVPGGPSAYTGSGPGARPGANPAMNSSADADTVMGNTEAQQSGSGGSGASGSSTPTAAATGAPHHAGVGGGSGSRPTQFGWAPLQGQNRPGPAFLPFPGPPLPPGIPSIEATYQYNRFPSSPHNPAAVTTNIPHGQLPLPDRDSEPWGSRHTSHQPADLPLGPSYILLGSQVPGPLSWYQAPLPNEQLPGHRRQPSHQSSQPAPQATTTTSSTSSHAIRLPAPDPRSRLPPYRSSGMSIPVDSGNDSSHALPPQGAQNPQTPSSSTSRPSRQRSGSGVTNAAAPPPPENQSGTSSRTTSASAPTSASASITGTPLGRPTSTTSRGPSHPEMRADMRDLLVRTYRALDSHSENLSDDDVDLPDDLPGRRLGPLDEERLAQYLRARQVARGQSTKKVASKKAIESLEPVNIADLPETSRTCDICYNDYGTESPEGITEQPLRIPKCKHIFGEHCIKKWFQDSNSCPYCRSELPTQQVFTQASAQSIREFLDSGHFSRRHGGRAQQEFLRQMSQLNDSTSRHNGSRAWQAGGGGSPSSETSGAPRRGHRHGSLHQRQSSSGPSTQTSQRPHRERHASDGDNSYRSANPSEIPFMPQPPPAVSYTSEPASQWMQHGEASFHSGPANRGPILPDHVPGTRGPAQGQAPVPEQSEQPFASTYSGENRFPGASNLLPPGPGRQWPE